MIVRTALCTAITQWHIYIGTMFVITCQMAAKILLWSQFRLSNYRSLLWLEVWFRISVRIPCPRKCFSCCSPGPPARKMPHCRSETHPLYPGGANFCLFRLTYSSFRAQPTRTHTEAPRTRFRQITYSGDTAKCPIMAISQVQTGNVSRISKLNGEISYNYLNPNSAPSHFQGWPRCFFLLSSSLACMQYLKFKIQY